MAINPEYIILTDGSSQDLAHKVAEKIELGYHLVGQPFAFRDTICQAMTTQPQLVH
ncbi:MAG TPA: DUF1737 domain-containing protein [Verrucomicrobiae bacterium]|nr:DUF1737 domain-containing protein [Verrucomicrobiae bacterium]